MNRQGSLSTPHPTILVLDMNSSVSISHSDHFGGGRYYPLFIFNKFDDLKRPARSGDAHRADDWRSLLVLVVPGTGQGALLPA